MMTLWQVLLGMSMLFDLESQTDLQDFNTKNDVLLEKTWLLISTALEKSRSLKFSNFAYYLTTSYQCWPLIRKLKANKVKIA